MSSKKIIKQTESTVVDLRTGESLHHVSTNVYKIATEPPFVKMYLDDLCVIANVSESLKKLLLFLLRRLDYEGYITLSPRARKEMAAAMGWTDGTFRNKLNELCKKGLLHPNSTNEYLANPAYFARGEWKDIIQRRRSFEMKITYTNRGRVIETNGGAEDAPQAEMDL